MSPTIRRARFVAAFSIFDSISWPWPSFRSAFPYDHGGVV